jgi:hypothetical protein
MRHLIKAAAVSLFAVGLASPSLAQVVVVHPYNAGPYGYVSPYGGYAYVPTYRAYRAGEYPIGEDTTGRPYFRSELGWRGGPPSGAPANPCWSGQREKNLC